MKQFCVRLQSSLGILAATPLQFTMLPSLMDTSAQFWREARLLRRCAHSRIVPLIAVGIDGQLLLLVMGLMRGGAVKAVLRDPERREQLRWRAR